MYGSDWEEYYRNDTKNESIHISDNKLIFQCEAGITLSTHKNDFEVIVHAFALKSLLIEINPLD
jgi:hypothetical protein